MTIEPFDAVLAEVRNSVWVDPDDLDRLAAAHAAEVAERDAARALDHAAMNALLARAEAAERDAGYFRWRLEEILPLFEEARDALPAITEPMRKLRGIRLDLADRMDAAGTRNREQYAAIATTEQADD